MYINLAYLYKRPVPSTLGGVHCGEEVPTYARFFHFFLRIFPERSWTLRGYCEKCMIAVYGPGAF